ncbi:phenylacetate-CoA oxygenase subunit PaaJ [Streptomyces sp. AJS327]|uniref:1,2-phenylacetyl-CoA epoxidase subunit PaaD n=1 Tax=Streptomyces sp. AJS327 TaxID=2545265 RepID=UPI0015E0088A|nr:1,2-phenylacetyl-CoA epoxidase subunit PaaD [Streptomyces sp. AJS327]MBA0052769.1 phenylacetate-CoA oxygenase subunit PaaJ [Streptomyces sp. AJS327]
MVNSPNPGLRTAREPDTATPGAEPTDQPTALERELLSLVGAVPDPELPVVSLAELGVIRGVRAPSEERVEVKLTPTYTGCPAIEAMCADIEQRLRQRGIAEVAIRTVLTPPWSTDDITQEGRRKLAEFGIAPPRGGARDTSGPIPLELGIRCPHCGSADTTLLSRFSSTACKALRRCAPCLEPFDHFKEV